MRENATNINKYNHPTTYQKLFIYQHINRFMDYGDVEFLDKYCNNIIYFLPRARSALLNIAVEIASLFALF